ncbi:Type I restriction modification system endonuclease (R) subunit, HsdR [Mycoplasmopsis bovigenitalium 51080]|uniref:Type I restriction enzyme endonuclease subunit n=1 Tax=Mycoplasmopsis bovigenitalium 51080 TaxID=1188235 RepID=N9V479_9BACT|nr:HsdR family type I site-specific deoxyribonuclease [Mycoplasmopsis bovigenitalium]ENY70142.1 Type I restriction modification system endonuclease (R) subunit, HsdR [Mycoplasmopsis bovigenitalium 51080]
MIENKDSERKFQNDLVNALQENGWRNINKEIKPVLESCTIEDLWNNFFKIVYRNNKDRLNNIDLTEGEKEQLKEKIKQCNSTAAANKLINSETIAIKRDNKKDTEKYGKEIYLKIFSRKEINAGDSVYQIAKEVELPWKAVNRKHRADVILLINGLPLFHIELKAKGISISKSITQISNYINSGGFDEILKLVQVSVAMSPEEMKYMPTDHKGQFINEEAFSYWHDDRNNVLRDWRDVVKHFLSIPMAHRLIANFTVCQENESIPLILRSYQFHAIDKIERKFRTDKKIFFDPNRTGCAKIGHIWHSTGSGKTLTSFKLSQLLLEWNIADTVVFVVDRTELGTQSFSEFSSFRGGKVNVKIASSTDDLISLMKEENLMNTIIVGSIQKQSRVNTKNFSEREINRAASQKIVFIFDEAHRSTSGEMIKNINETFPNAALIGFTGTPLGKENSKNGLETKDIFGELLHSYTLKNGIQDKKILDFNIEYNIFTKYIESAIKNIKESAIKFVKKGLYTNKINKIVDKLSHFRDLNNDDKKINRDYEDDLLRGGYYDDKRFKKLIVEDILNTQEYFLDDKRYSAIFAVKSIPDAIEYFELFAEACDNNEKYKDFKFTALFDQSLDHEEELAKTEYKADAINNIIKRYNKDFEKVINVTNSAEFKKDLSKRLSQKGNFSNIKNEEKLQLLIVVNQMLTGFDSKYINTIYFDKVMTYEHLIQAISRTNRTLPGKDFGNVIFYRQPNTMNYNLDKALSKYADINIESILTTSFEDRLLSINNTFAEVKKIFLMYSKHTWFGSIYPEQHNNNLQYTENMRKANKLINKIINDVRAAKIMGYSWERAKNPNDICSTITYTEHDFDALVARNEDITRYLKEHQKENHASGTKDESDPLESQNLSSEYSFYREKIALNLAKLNDIIKLDRTRERIVHAISSFTTEHQEILLRILEPYFNNQKNWDYLDINEEFTEAILNIESEILKEFCNEWNFDSKTINKIINSTEPINVNNRLHDLCEKSYTNEIRQKFALKLNRKPKKALPADFISFVEKWIEEQKDKK